MTLQIPQKLRTFQKVSHRIKSNQLSIQRRYINIINMIFDVRPQKLK